MCLGGGPGVRDTSERGENGMKRGVPILKNPWTLWILLVLGMLLGLISNCGQGRGWGFFEKAIYSERLKHQ